MLAAIAGVAVGGGLEMTLHADVRFTAGAPGLVYASRPGQPGQLCVARRVELLESPGCHDLCSRGEALQK